MAKPRLLDLFCGAGGAAMGYYRAGFQVVGIDLNPQPRFPFDFMQMDAIEYLDWYIANGSGFDAIHASPPCQGYSSMSNCRPGLADEYPRLIEPIRERLEATGLPYVIENVVGAPLSDPVMLCGRMFGFELYRHRLFETNWPLAQPEHPGSLHLVRASKAGHWTEGTVISVAGNCAPIALARKVMDIDWMRRDELGEAIPPYFTQYVGSALTKRLAEERYASGLVVEPARLDGGGDLLVEGDGGRIVGVGLTQGLGAEPEQAQLFVSDGDVGHGSHPDCRPTDVKGVA